MALQGNVVGPCPDREQKYQQYSDRTSSRWTQSVSETSLCRLGRDNGEARRGLSFVQIEARSDPRRRRTKSGGEHTSRLQRGPAKVGFTM